MYKVEITRKNQILSKKIILASIEKKTKNIEKKTANIERDKMVKLATINKEKLIMVNTLENERAPLF
jgi:hypothetical protein